MQRPWLFLSAAVLVVALAVLATLQVRWVNEEPAKEIIRQNDQDRAAFHRRYFKADWNDPLNYHLVLTTSRLGIAGVIETLVSAARSRWPDMDGRQ